MDTKGSARLTFQNGLTTGLRSAPDPIWHPVRRSCGGNSRRGTGDDFKGGWTENACGQQSAEAKQAFVGEPTKACLAKDCRLESVSTNISRLSYGPQQPEGFNVNGSMSYQITLK